MSPKIVFTHTDKLLYPADRISKAEVIEYYVSISPFFLKYAKQHPLTLQRYPQGIEKPGFFQKHAHTIPEWINRVEIPGKKSPILFVMANKSADLAYLANLNTLVFHSALFSIKNPFPDTIIWDLDPSTNDFKQVIRLAFLMKQVLDDLGIHTRLKTSGSKGLHIHAPLKAGLSFEQAHDFSRHIALALVQAHPSLATVEPLKKNRKGRILIDYHRNFYSQTAVAAYSLRSLPGAPIATPISWTELGKTVRSPQQFTLRNIGRRLQRSGDMWSKENCPLNPIKKFRL